MKRYEQFDGEILGMNFVDRVDAKFAIGTQYKTRGKFPRLCTVTDIHTTVNYAGEVVKHCYVSTHEFMGQTITDSNVVETTIAMGLVKQTLG